MVRSNSSAEHASTAIEIPIDPVSHALMCLKSGIHRRTAEAGHMNRLAQIANRRLLNTDTPKELQLTIKDVEEAMRSAILLALQQTNFMELPTGATDVQITHAIHAGQKAAQAISLPTVDMTATLSDIAKVIADLIAPPDGK